MNATNDFTGMPGDTLVPQAHCPYFFTKAALIGQRVFRRRCATTGQGSSVNLTIALAATH